MKPWVGAVAAAAAILAAPSVSLAGEDDPAQLQFKLPSAEAVHDFEALGLSMDHNMQRNPDGTAVISAWATDEQAQRAELHGYEVVGTITSRFAIDAIRTERDATLKKLKAANDALHGVGVKKKGSSLANGDIHAQRADYFENNVGRFLSIEANAEGAHFTGDTNPPILSYVGPTVTAEWFDAAGNRLNGGTLGVYPDPDVSPDYYQYHYSVFRVGNKGDGGVEPATVRVASSNGTVDTINVREWVAKDPPKPAQTYKSGFVTHYNDSHEAYKKMRDLATEFSNISEAVKLPEQTRGYQRFAQTMLGYYAVPTAQNPNPTPNAITPYVTFDATNRPVAGTAPPTQGSDAAPTQARTVVLTSRAYGHLGGNNLAAQIVDPAGATNQALSVSLNGNKISINPATDANGAITSTAAQVIGALNANQQISNIVVASKFRASPADGVVRAGPTSPLSDLLRAPSTIPRGPQDQWMLRIGKTRNGSNVGVFLYCQEHGNEIATSGVCLETAERLVRNYGTDPETTALVDNLEIFIIPQINGDGAVHSLYDSNRRKNLSHDCFDTTKFPGNDTDPAQRNSWGVDMNRNFKDGSIFDGFQGASSTNCLSGNFSGVFEHSEPEVRNETWVQTNFRNIKFINNIHSSGGLFMWPPGSYTPARVPLPYPPYGTLNFFDQTGKSVLDGIKSHRGTAILPQQTGPVIDVLYSAAGNSADEAWYSNGIIGYDFEIGATHYNDTGSGPATCGPGQQPPFGDSMNDCLDNEGFHEAMEFASGNIGLLREALKYAQDTTAPNVSTVWGADGIRPFYSVRFTSNEAASIYYTIDGSTPTTASTEWKPPRARALPLPLEVAPGTTLKWIATDYKGNVSAVKSQAFGFEEETGTVGGNVPATLSLSLGPAAQFGAITPGVNGTYNASTTANVISSAGDALLSVADPSSTNTGHLTNGSFFLPQPLQARARNATTTSPPYNNVGSSASPLNLLSWSGPISNDAVTLEFRQVVNANDALRTGTYSKALTFTLSTTQP